MRSMTLPYSHAFFSRCTVIWVSSLLVLTACSSQPTAEPGESPTGVAETLVVAGTKNVEPSSVIEESAAVSPSTGKSAAIEPSTTEVITSQPASEESNPVVVAEKATQDSVAQSNTPKDTVAFWLGEAGWAFEQDKLTTPKTQSAYHYLTKVLAKEPGNPQALVALEKIVQRYYKLLQSSLNKGKVKQARVFLSRAGTVIPKHHQLGAMGALIDNYVPKKTKLAAVAKAEIAAPETAEPAMRKQKLLVPEALIKQQDELLAQWLIRVAKKAHQLQATMLIVAPTDAQARWVYQTMNSADPEQRIRANIKRSSPSRVEISYLARKDELEVYSN